MKKHQRDCSYSSKVRQLANYRYWFYYKANECGDPESWLLNPAHRYWDENSHIEIFRNYPNRLVGQRAAKRFGKMVRRYWKS